MRQVHRAGEKLFVEDELIALRLSQALLDRLDAYVAELQKSEARFQT